MPNTRQKEIAGYIPLNRFYKWLAFFFIFSVGLSISIGMMTYYMGKTFGQEKCATQGLQATQEFEHKYNEIIADEYNTLLNSDSLDDYILHH